MIPTLYLKDLRIAPEYYSGPCNVLKYAALYVPIERIFDVRAESDIKEGDYLNMLNRIGLGVDGVKIQFLPVVVNTAWYNKYLGVLDKLFVLGHNVDKKIKILHVDVRVFSYSP